MYLKKAIYNNVGPLELINLDFSFHDNGNPKPIVIVGENGSGKSTFISNIVDALYEMAEKKFNNALKNADNSFEKQYYKAITNTEIQVNKPYMVSYLLFKGLKDYSYIFKSGNITSKDFEKKFGIKENTFNWNDNINYKNVTINEKQSNDEWATNVICYFGPDRYEQPSWLGDKYYNIEDFLHPTVQNIFSGKLRNQILVKNVTKDTLQWLLDIIADSRSDIHQDDNKQLSIENVDVSNLLLLKKARTNIETILSKIVGEEVYFALNFRNQGGSRFKIMKKSDNSIFCKSLDSLSTGQSALFNMFATIVRYADSNDITKSIDISNIQGLVIIDEIELHLHSNLQKEVLPQLISMFPKIQFIISSHSTLFLLGMRDTLGENNFDVFEMPFGNKIDVEKFSEFKKAYEYIKSTTKYQEDAKKIIQDINTDEKAIIITEGHTDWKHLKAAYNALKSNDNYKELFEGLSFEFLEYGPNDKYKLDMGNDALCTLCESISKLPQNKKYIFIADRDVPRINNKMSDSNSEYKNWGNNVFSFILPVPSHRKETQDICIEHLYTDNEITLEWKNQEDGINHRLFFANEFDKNGKGKKINFFCTKKHICGKDNITIIDGSNDATIIDFNNNSDINYALSKSKFADLILNKEPPFDHMNFDNFISIFKIIKDIINEKNQ